MKTISRQAITDMWDRLCELDKEATDALVKEFMANQPALGIYLFASTEEIEGGAENTAVIDLAIATWMAMRDAHGGALEQVPPEKIEAAEEANQQRLEDLDEGSEAEWEDAVRNLAEKYNQHELLEFGLEVLMSGHEDAPELAPDTIGLELLWLKTVIDCLDQ